jgi:hypothetical protein
MQGGAPALYLGPGPQDVNLDVFKQLNYSHKGSIQIYGYAIPPGIFLLADLFESIHRPMHRLLRELVLFYTGIRCRLLLICDLEVTKYGVIQDDTPIGSPFSVITHPDFIDKVVQNSASFLILSLNLFSDKSSDWSIKKLVRLEIHIGNYQPLSGRSFIEIPHELRRRGGLTNIKLKNS